MYRRATYINRATKPLPVRLSLHTTQSKISLFFDDFILAVKSHFKSGMLCQICQETFQGKRERGRWAEPQPFSYNHHRSADDVQLAAHRGCHFCTVLWGFLSLDEVASVLCHSSESQTQDHVQISASRTESTVDEDETIEIHVAFPLVRPQGDHWFGNFCTKIVGLIPAQGKDS